VGAFIGEALGGGESDAAVASGDDRYFSVELLRHATASSAV